MQYNYPFKIDKSGRVATVDENQHIHQLVEQVLFTSPGERVNRPEFGCGINQLVFSPNSDELVTATQFLVQGALQRWLGNLIHVESVTINNTDSKLRVTVQYIVKKDMERHTAQFSREAQ